jgi:hypothetical protein
MVADENLDSRYVCQLCGVCIATVDNLTETQGDVLTFRQLYGNAGRDKSAKTVMCPCCQEALGTRSDSSFFLRRERVKKNAEKLEILVCSLKSPEIQDLVPVLSDAFPHSNITPRVLQKSELRGFQLQQGPKSSPDMVVVVHRNEGRALLTDRNGFYHDVLGSAWQRTLGNVLVILTRADPKADSELFDAAMLRSLATQGDQPTIGAISALGRVLTWETSPSMPQVTQLKTLASKAFLRETPTASEGIPGAWAYRPPAKSSSQFFCMVL